MSRHGSQSAPCYSCCTLPPLPRLSLGISLKYESVRQRVVGSRRGQKLNRDRAAARIEFAVAQRGGWTHARVFCLRANVRSFKIFILTPGRSYLRTAHGSWHPSHSRTYRCNVAHAASRSKHTRWAHAALHTTHGQLVHTGCSRAGFRKIWRQTDLRCIHSTPSTA